ncbi:MAG: metallophosphoesterase [Pseudonocardiales bacterium]|nr:metallophosphoesterase [Pseudonocardiales bacterium]
MRIHVVSDVHGNVDALARAGSGADALLVLGDLIDFVDYHDHSAGILGSVFGSAAVHRFTQLRSGGAPDEAYAFVRELWSRVPDSRDMIREAVIEQYERLFAVLPSPTYATPGNVDLPELWPRFMRAGVYVLDGQTAEIGGLRCGFVGGGLLPDGGIPQRDPVFRSYLRTPAQYAVAVSALGRVDLLCSHIPPAVPELLYDVQARRSEIGSEQLLAVIRQDRPRIALFGHVHQPLARRVRVGRTECVNVGHFQRTGTPHVVRW